jgi:hypothetical protein
MGHGTHKKMSYEIQSTNDQKNAQKHVKEIKKMSRKYQNM